MAEKEEEEQAVADAVPQLGKTMGMLSDPMNYFKWKCCFCQAQSQIKVNLTQV